MKSSHAVNVAVLGATALMIFLGTGCATKKHVRSVVAPLESRIGTVEGKTNENTASIGDLESGVSRVDEKALDAQRRAQAAHDAANAADHKAAQAGTRADSAHEMAEKNQMRIEEVETEFARTIDNLDNFHLAASTNVLFAFDKSELSKEAMEGLDEFAGQLNGKRKFVIEVQGFTDKTGASAYNLELSRRRAQAVVRYLTVKHQVPLRRIQLLGVGSELPTADNSTRDGRKQNRRVEVKVFSAGEQRADTNTGATVSELR
jgi:outer membrane protein OmpA-like peptidoglycan-associated protein